MNELFIQILSQLEDGIVMFDASGKVFYSNLESTRFSGVVADGRMVNKAVMEEVSATRSSIKKLPKDINLNSHEEPGINDVHSVLLCHDKTYCLYLRDDSARAKFNILKENLFELINHELRTPMTSFMGGIHMVSELLAKGKTKDVKYLHSVTRAAIENGARVVNNMKRLLEIAESYGEEPIRSEDHIQLVDVAYDVVEAVRENSLKKQLTIKVVMRGKPIGIVYGSYSWLKRAVEECVQNAIENSNEGAEIHLQLEQVGTFASIIIRDYGRGLTPQVKQFLYEPFTGGENKEFSSGKEPGIGLALASRVVEIHGGHIKQFDVENGVEFRIELPTGAGQRIENDMSARQVQRYANDLVLLIKSMHVKGSVHESHQL